jgi:hypothetical protein
LMKNAGVESIPSSCANFASSLTAAPCRPLSAHCLNRPVSSFSLSASNAPQLPGRARQ